MERPGGQRAEYGRGERQRAADARVVVKDEIRYQGDDGGPGAEAHDVEHEQEQIE